MIRQLAIKIRFSQKLLLQRRQFSSERYLTDPDQPKIPDLPEDLILSQYLRRSTSKPSIDIRSSPQQPQKWSYQECMNKTPFGSVQSVFHKNCELTLMATNYQRANPLNLIETLIKNNPDIVVMQVRPNIKNKLSPMKQNFQIIPKNDKGIFSDVKYLEQLEVQQQQIQQMEGFSAVKEYFQQLINKRRSQSQTKMIEKEPIFTSTINNLNKNQLLHGYAAAAGLYYAHKYKKRLYFAEMPQQTSRQWVANNNSLLELQQIFKRTCHMMPRYRSLALTPYQMATLMVPQVFLAQNDLYMATLIQMLIGRQHSKRIKNQTSASLKGIKIFGMFHLMQNEAVLQALKRGATEPIINSLIAKPPKSSLVRNLTFWEILEKHILLDLMHYGDEVLKVPVKQFSTTNKMVEFYAEASQQPNNKKLLMKFRHETIRKYLGVMKQKLVQGREQMQKEMMREAIREHKKTI